LGFFLFCQDGSDDEEFWHEGEGWVFDLIEAAELAVADLDERSAAVVTGLVCFFLG